MGAVGPIKDQKVLERMKEYLREENTRNYLLFRLGINLGLSIQTLLHLRVEDLAGKKEICLDGYRLRMSESLRKDISFYIGERKEGYLFRIRRDQPLSRFQLYNILRDAAEAADYGEAVGALTLRKTFAYWAHKEQRIYLPLLSKYLNHHTVAYTLRYIEADDLAGAEVCLPELDL